jgi:hypothetical protein
VRGRCKNRSEEESPLLVWGVEENLASLSPNPSMIGGAMGGWDTETGNGRKKDEGEDRRKTGPESTHNVLHAINRNPTLFGVGV